jgi:molybdenum cofactor cytidylyltransferase
MGTSKPLLPWQNDTLLGYQLSVLKKIGVSETIVVLGHSSEAVIKHIHPYHEAKVMINPDYLKGKTTSIKLGVQAVSNESNNLLLIAVDQPRPAELLSDLIHAHETTESLITQPFYKGKGGHPLLFDNSLFPELEQISEDHRGVREIMERNSLKINRVPIMSGIVLLDINTKQDLLAAQHFFCDQ